MFDAPVSVCRHSVLDEKIAFAELQINVITWIGVPDEACDLYKKLTISPKPWVAPFKKRERSAAHPRLF